MLSLVMLHHGRTLSVANKNTVLVVAAHSDDEALGCGGTIAKHVDNGDMVFAAFMTDGVGARVSSESKEVDERYVASETALAILGVTKNFRFEFPDNQMDSVPLLSVVKKVESIVSEIKPNIVYTHFAGDLNIDHQVTHRAVMTACRPQAWGTVKEIYCFEVLSATEWSSNASPIFIPQKIIDISEQWKKKQQALKAYAKEMRAAPHSRSIECVEAQAKLRGNTHGFSTAEAFYVERILA